MNINCFLPGQTLPSIALQVRLESETSSDHLQAQPKKTRNKYRPTKQRPPLEELLQAWRKNALSNDDITQGWLDEWVLSDLSISKLAREEEGAFESTADVVSFLEESSEWADSYGEQVHSVIDGYNRSLPKKPARASTKLLDSNHPATHITAGTIPSLVKTTSDLYDTDTTLVNSYSPTSSPQSSRCATPDLDLPLSAAVRHPRSESVFESPNPRPKKRAFKLIGMDGSKILEWDH
jgi:hypothetical protein